MDVRLATVLLVVSVFVNSCVHPSRKPAQVQQGESCEEGFQKVFPLEEMQGFAEAIQRGQRIKSYILSQIDAKMKDGVRKKPASCEREVRLQDLKFDLDLRIEDIERSDIRTQQFQHYIMPMLSGPTFSDPKALEASLCFADCMDQVRDIEKRNECAQHCDLRDVDGVDRETTQLARLFFACRDVQGKIDHARVKQNFDEYLGSFARFVRANQKAIFAENADSKRVLVILRQQSERLKKFIATHERPKTACTRPQPQLKMNLSEAVVTLRLAGGIGSGFIVNVEGSRRVVTAAHVFDKSRLKHLHTQSVSVYPAFSVGKGDSPKVSTVSFVVAPGMQDFSNDISTALYPEKSETFNVIESGKVPDPKGVYYIAGFPDSEPGFQIYPCEFKGISQGIGRDPKPGYSFECHDVKGHIQGMSGGPVFDQDGKVWGVISYQVNLLNRIIARPLSQNSHGKLILGFQEAFSTPYCAAEDNESFHTCQIVPGASELGP